VIVGEIKMSKNMNVATAAVPLEEFDYFEFLLEMRRKEKERQKIIAIISHQTATTSRFGRESKKSARQCRNFILPMKFS